VAACIRVVGFFNSRPDKRRVAHVQKMEPKEKAIPAPAKTKLGKLFTALMDELDSRMTFRAKRRVTEATVVKMSWTHQTSQERRRSKIDVSLIKESTLTLGRSSSTSSASPKGPSREDSFCLGEKKLGLKTSFEILGATTVPVRVKNESTLQQAAAMLQIKRIAFALTILQGGSCVSENLERKVLCTWCFSMELCKRLALLSLVACGKWHMRCGSSRF
jgi:hypothetical protein